MKVSCNGVVTQQQFNQVLFTPIKFHKYVKNRMSEVCQVQLKKLQENSWRLSKEKSGKAQVKKSATLLNVYFFSQNFARS